jgi:hypothetical protein
MYKNFKHLPLYDLKSHILFQDLLFLNNFLPALINLYKSFHFLLPNNLIFLNISINLILLLPKYKLICLIKILNNTHHYKAIQILTLAHFLFILNNILILLFLIIFLYFL